MCVYSCVVVCFLYGCLRYTCACQVPKDEGVSISLSGGDQG